MRSSRASSPVVSVSKTISRIESLRCAENGPDRRAGKPEAGLLAGFSRQVRDDRVDCTARRFHALAGVDDEIGPPALFRVRHLPGAGSPRIFPPSCPAATARARAEFRRRGDDHDLVDAVAAAGLEQQRNVEHDQRRARRHDDARGRHRRRRGPADGRSFPALSSPAHRRARASDSFAAVDDAVDDRPGKAASTSGAASPA